MPRLLAAWLALTLVAAPAMAQEARPALTDAAALAAAGREAARAPLFAAELARVKRDVDAAMTAGIVVPVPKDPGGGYTHEQHKRNQQAIYGAGMLYRATGDAAYADYVRRLLLAYANLYPTLGPHPAKANEAAGRLFWQSLNDAVWLVYAVQGYDAVREAIPAADRRIIDDDVFRRAARFLSQEDARTFDRIHNHATWSCAGVGMTGYMLRDRALVDAALTGRDGSGRTGFLRQIDELFSPDGYYSEGPYYQRYAIQPFLLFAKAIQENDPGVGVFKRRDGVLLKAITSLVQMTYDGQILPFNDALPDKGLKTAELYDAMAIGYAETHDPALLSIAARQGRVTPTAEGAAVARDLAAGRAKPFPYASALLRDGARGEQGALAVMRTDPGPDGAGTLLAAKNTAMGLGHGHFDKLNWVFYDNGQAVVTDYGAARFLNVESKDGGRYLKENESWAKQTVAHNTLVVDETSDYGGKWQAGEADPPKQLFFSADLKAQVSTAEMAGAWSGVTFRRTLVLLPVEGSRQPLAVDLLRVAGERAATYDLPLHYAGHLTSIGLPLKASTAERPVLGKTNGYQHVWVDAEGALPAEGAAVTWLLDGRFYTYRMAPPAGSRLVLGETGANDPRFNLRREPMLMQRVVGAKDATFLSVLEPHGALDGAAETVTGEASRILRLDRVRAADAEIVTIGLRGGRTVRLAVADSVDPAAAHAAVADGRPLAWKGHFARFDEAAPK